MELLPADISRQSVVSPARRDAAGAALDRPRQLPRTVRRTALPARAGQYGDLYRPDRAAQHRIGVGTRARAQSAFARRPHPAHPVLHAGRAADGRRGDGSTLDLQHRTTVSPTICSGSRARGRSPGSPIRTWRSRPSSQSGCGRPSAISCWSIWRRCRRCRRRCSRQLRLDGARPWDRFWSITWPLLRPTTWFAIVIALILSFQAFDFVNITTQGGPSNATNLLVFYIYQNGFQYFRLGFAAAISVVMFVLVYGLSALVSLWFNR